VIENNVSFLNQKSSSSLTLPFYFLIILVRINCIDNGMQVKENYALQF